MIFLCLADSRCSRSRPRYYAFEFGLFSRYRIDSFVAIDLRPNSRDSVYQVHHAILAFSDLNATVTSSRNHLTLNHLTHLLRWYSSIRYYHDHLIRLCMACPMNRSPIPHLKKKNKTIRIVTFSIKKKTDAQLNITFSKTRIIVCCGWRC